VLVCVAAEASAVVELMVEKNPWWKNVQGPFPKWEGPIGCKEDGGGSHRGRGTVGKMLVHRAVNNHDKEGTPLACAFLSRPHWADKNVASQLQFHRMLLPSGTSEAAPSVMQASQGWWRRMRT